jgi:hypothetical protein
MKVTNQKAALAQPALTLKSLRPLVTLVAMLFAFGAKAQNSHDVVMYDPLFWKDELNIRNSQSHKIEEINNEFYDKIRQLKDERTSREAKNTALERGLQERSQKIFETLQPKQRRKLEKIIDKTTPITAP